MEGVTKKPKSNLTEYQGFIRNTFKLLRVNPAARIKKDALDIINGILVKLMEKVKETALEISSKTTLQDTHILAAIDVILTTELARHAKTDAHAKVARFVKLVENSKSARVPGDPKKKPESLRGRLEMQFPISRVHTWLAKPSRNGYANRVSAKASIALTAVADYICAEILDLAEQHMRYAKNPAQVTVARNNVKYGIDTDEELCQLCKKLGIVIRGPSSTRGVAQRFVPLHLQKAREKRMRAKAEAQAEAEALAKAAPESESD